MLSIMRKDTKARRMLELVEAAYGSPPRFRRTPPIDELIRTVLSQNTNDTNSLAAFAVLRKRFRPWGRLAAADTRTVAGAIRHAGLANIKAARIKGILSEIRRREGRLSLAGLARLDTVDMVCYLRSLKGVGPKTAACVALFSFGRPVMPVDTHIFRVAGRLGLISAQADIEDAHRLLTETVRKGLIYRFHLGIIEHGRRTCHSRNPECGACVLYNLCIYRGKVRRHDPQGQRNRR